MKNFGFDMTDLPLIRKNESPESDQQQIDEMNQGLVNEIVDFCFNQGILYFQITHGAKAREMETFLRCALVARYPRNRFYLANGMPPGCIFSNLDYEPFFQTQLERCDVDYFDFYSLNPLNHLNYTDTLEYGGFEFLTRLKAEGRARHIGFFFDGQPQLLDAILSDHPEMEFIQMNLNYQDWYDPTHPSRPCYETALKHRRPVIVSDPLKGSSLCKPPASAPQAFLQCHPDWPPEVWALRFAASLHHVPLVFIQAFSCEMKKSPRLLKKMETLTEEEQLILKNIALAQK